MSYNKRTRFAQLFRGASLLYLLFILTFLFSACGGSSGGGGGGGSDVPVSEGVFVDSPVEGLNYSTSTQSGTTDENGVFKYINGEVIQFWIGDPEYGEVVLGEGLAKEVMSPIDLVPGAADERNLTVTNICRFLQSLDMDGNLNNGICITPDIAEFVEGCSIDFSDPDFNDNPDLVMMFDDLNEYVFPVGEERSLCSAHDAQCHLCETLGLERTPIDGEEIVPLYEDSAVFILSSLGFYGQISGTGVVLDTDGNILTNNHIIDGAATIQVRLPDTDNFIDASIVGRSPCDDLAVIRVNRNQSSFEPAPIGNSSELVIGSTVYAVGYPVDPVNPDFDETEIAVNGPGLVSRLDSSYDVLGLRNLIQSDISINYGNSGGPLINTYGEVVGINTLMVIGLQSITYAIAIDEAKIVSDELLQGIDINWVGVNLIANDPGLQIYGIPYMENTSVILSCPSGGEFAEDSWFPGDIVITAADEPIANMGDLCSVLRTQRSGDTIEIYGYGQTYMGSRDYIYYVSEITVP